MIGYELYSNVTNPSVIQFENANEGRSYPFDDDVTAISTDGGVMPDGIIADAHLTIPTGADAYLSSVYVSDKMLSICIKVMSSDSLAAALSVSVSADSYEAYVPLRLDRLTGSNDVGGIVTLGQVDFTEFSTPLSLRFQDRSVRFADSAVARYVPAGLRKIVDDRTGDSLSGDISIEFSSHIEASDEQDGIKLSLDSTANGELLPECMKNQPINACGSTPVSKINGVAPDSAKRLVIWFH